MKEQNKNFLYNSVYQIFIFIIPMITTPYISRTLSVDNVGIYAYTYSIVYYFMLFSMLGINNYGAREIAKCVSKEELGFKFKSIYFLQLFLNIIAIFAYIIYVLLFNHGYKVIMIIQLIFLISVAFDINWFFFGREKFKITVTRNIIIKLASLIFIFTFVKNDGDLWKYTLIMSVTTLISQIYLWPFLLKEIKWVKISIKDVVSHLKSCLILFIPVVSYSIYRVMDKTMIGSISNTIELGNYESAEKIINIPISFVTALGTVMLPHMSKKSKDDIKNSILSTFELTFFITIPTIVGLFIISKDFSNLFFGSEFVKTSSIIRILLSTVLFSSISNVIRTNYLIPLRKDNIYIYSTIIAAIVNLILNLIFIGKFGAYGACIGTVCAEFVLMIYQVAKSRDFINYKDVLKLLMKYTMKSLLMGATILIVGILIQNSFIRVLMQIVIALAIYFVLNINYIKHDFLGK